MFQQKFAISDIGVVLFLIFLEALLSADNALVMAIMARRLPVDQQRKALFYGLLGAFVFRFIAIIIAVYILMFWWLQLIGAVYLLVLPIKHFFVPPPPHHMRVTKASFWRTVVAIEITDIAFAIDSVLAGVALVEGPSKLWVVYLGSVLGIVLLRVAATWVIRLLHVYPALDGVAYALVGWVGLKMLFLSGHNYVKHYNATHDVPLGFSIPPMNSYVFWGVMLIIIVIGGWYAAMDPRRRL
jgi:YkoY family integral membrane protein